jgi:hypothetical protein
MLQVGTERRDGVGVGVGVGVGDTDALCLEEVLNHFGHARVLLESFALPVDILGPVEKHAFGQRVIFHPLQNLSSLLLCNVVCTALLLHAQQ